ncbi:MAG: methyltransferase domain-containing protein [Candidatus Thermoplasmatota archaeon]|nr:methyltransferase domain-containing protein [Candidatus Thermoplasmatota archaeon]
MPHNRSPEELHHFIKKLEQQALETAEERHPLYIRAGLKDAHMVLDVGCGSGAVTKDVAAHTNGTVVALDDALDLIDTAREILTGLENVVLMAGDAHHLPFRDETFDIALCNLVLMWSEHPQQVVSEMARVVRPGGRVVASLEPDFGGKIHWPENERVDPIFAGEAIRRRGGDPHIGRKLRMLFVRAGLDTEVGIGNQRIWSCTEDRASYTRSRDFYWNVLRRAGLSDREIRTWEQEYLTSLDQGVQVNFFPQFYAIGTKRDGQG